MILTHAVTVTAYTKGVMLKKFLLTVCIATLLTGCATKPLILPQKEQAPNFNHAVLADKKLAIWIIDSLNINTNGNDAKLSAKQYRYYLKRVLPEKILQQQIFSKVAFQYQLENQKSVHWTDAVVAQHPQALMVKVPANGTQLSFPGDDYDFVLLIGSIDVQKIPKKLTEQVVDIVEVAQNSSVQHSMRYAIWDNNNGNIAEKGIAVVKTIELEKYLGTLRWEQLMADYAAEIFQKPSDNQ